MTDPTKETPAVDEIVARYIALRDKKAEIKAKYDAEVEAIDAAMSRVENYLLKLMTELGVESIRTSAGTPYVSRRTSATVADWEVFLDWVRSNGEWSMLERRANKTVVQSWREEHNDLPPGLNWREERVVNVNRS
jgi:hypothetical protein